MDGNYGRNAEKNSVKNIKLLKNITRRRMTRWNLLIEITVESYVPVFG